jgi:Ca2+-binding EF-hand superfamily protein
MIDRRSFIGKICLLSLSTVLLPIAFSPMTAFAASSPLKALDKDNDATLDLAEVKDAASAVFDKLEKDSDATLDAKEIGGRLGKKEFKEADPDNDKTLSKDEYLALVEKLFNAADADKDGTLTAKELHSKAGRALLRLIR